MCFIKTTRSTQTPLRHNMAFYIFEPKMYLRRQETVRKKPVRFTTTYNIIFNGLPLSHLAILVLSGLGHIVKV